MPNCYFCHHNLNKFHRISAISRSTIMFECMLSSFSFNTFPCQICEPRTAYKCVCARV